MADSQVTFDIVARDRASREFRNVGTAADRAGDRFRRFGRITGRVAKTAGVALGGALVSVAYGLGNAAKAAADEEREMAVLRNTLRKATKATDKQVDSTEEWITALQNATGVADSELRPALGKLAIATGSVRKSQKLLNVALDIAAARGVSLDSVVKALGKGAQGTTTGLGRLGLATKDASGKALTFDEILQNANKTMGGAAATAADTAAGRFQILRARFDDLKESIGARLLPYLNRLGEWFLRDGIPALQRFGGWLRDKLWPALKNFGSSAGQGILGFFSNLGRALGIGGDGAKNMKSSFKNFGDVLTQVVLPMLGEFIEKTLPALGTAVGAQIRIVETLASVFVDLAIIGNEAVSDLVKTSLNGFGAIIEGYQKITFGPLGARVDRAAEKFDRFRERTIANLDQTEGSLRNLKSALDALHDKTINVGVNYVTTGRFTGKALPIDDARASGGPVAAGRAYLVGERGPEVVTPSRSGYVHDAKRTAGMLGGVHVENLTVQQAPGEDAGRAVVRGLTGMMYRLGTA